MKTSFRFGVVAICLTATGFDPLLAMPAPEPKYREFLMHTANSKESSPECVKVSQTFDEVEQYADAIGNVSSFPVIRSSFASATCTPKAFAFEQNPGASLDTQITPDSVPWRNR